MEEIWVEKEEFGEGSYGLKMSEARGPIKLTSQARGKFGDDDGRMQR